ncbi:hypothetical protein BY996DRAFT_7202187 [Phakopsora pachyrhizi]|nr:hypothetical protein BY996DRAFT_7202187 [Phakopsora pachyrhizi]
MERKRLREKMLKFRKSHSEISRGRLTEVSSQRSLPLLIPECDEFTLLKLALKRVSSEDFIEYFTAKIRLSFEDRKPGTKEEYDGIARLFDALDRLEIPLEEFKSLGNSILSNNRNLNFLAIVVSKIITNEWGYTSIFQTSNIKEFLLNHPDLARLHRLMTVCDENHWKKIEYTFLRAHLEGRYYNDVLYNDMVLDTLRAQVKDGFLKLDKPLKDGFKLPYEFNLNYYKDKPFESYTTSVFVFHTINYLRNYYKGVGVRSSLAYHAPPFKGIFRIFHKALKVQMAIINPENVKKFRLKDSDATSTITKYLRTMIHHPTSDEQPDSYFQLDDVSLKMLKASSYTDNWISKILAAAKEFHDEYNKFKSDWPLAYGNTDSVYKDKYFKIYYADYIRMIDQEKGRIEKNCAVIEALKVKLHSEPLIESQSNV